MVTKEALTQSWRCGEVLYKGVPSKRKDRYKLIILLLCRWQSLPTRGL